MGYYCRDLCPGDLRTDDGAQKRELHIVERWWWGGGVKHAERGEGRGTQPKWRTRDRVRMRRVVHVPVRHCGAVCQVVWVSNPALRVLDFTSFCLAETNRVGPPIFPVWG